MLSYRYVIPVSSMSSLLSFKFHRAHLINFLHACLLDIFTFIPPVYQPRKATEAMHTDEQLNGTNKIPDRSTCIGFRVYMGSE